MVPLTKQFVAHLTISFERILFNKKAYPDHHFGTFLFLLFFFLAAVAASGVTYFLLRFRPEVAQWKQQHVDGCSADSIHESPASPWVPSGGKP
jgi:hypothetical protein